MINPPVFVSKSKNEVDELKKLKNQLENQKAQKIRNIYKSSSVSSFTTVQRYGSISSEKKAPKNEGGEIKR